MELIDIKFLYDSGLVTKTVQTGDTFLLGRPNVQRGDGYSVLAISASDLSSYFLSQVPPTSGGLTVEAGTFSRLATDGSGVQTITTTKKPKIIFFNTLDNAVPNSSQNGVSTMTFESVNGTLVTGGGQGFCIGILASGNGYKASVTALRDTSFDVTWTVVGSGRDLTVQWYSLT